MASPKDTKDIKRVIVNDKHTFYWKEGDLHTHSGVLKEKDIKKSNELKSHKGAKFKVFDANFLDKLKNIKRGPATLTFKDAALVTFFSGIGKMSKVVDAGAGCGLLAACLGRVANKVVSYERREDFLKIAEKNLRFLKASNVQLKHKDIYEGISERNVDAITLDLPEPWQAIPHAYKSLKSGGTLITYLPSVVQVERTVAEAEKSGFFHSITFETLFREWHIEGKKVRPKSQMIGHTAFISIFRKI